MDGLDAQAAGRFEHLGEQPPRALRRVTGSLRSPSANRSFFEVASFIRTQPRAVRRCGWPSPPPPALVKVRQRIVSGRAPDSSSRSTRPVSTCVLPVPADADSAAWTRGSDRPACAPCSWRRGFIRFAHARFPSRADAIFGRRGADDGENERNEANEERRSKLVKAGVAVGIGSAAIVAALLYASKIKKKPRARPHSRPYHSSSRIS